MRTLVTGGAGYIGSHVAALLRERGDEVVVVDDLSSGLESRLEGESPAHIDLASDRASGQLTELMRERRTEAVVHLAARKQVDESTRRPMWYYRENVGGLANLLGAMESAGVDSLVFSSTAAVYGSTVGTAIRESDPADPISPYGETKLAGERLISAATRAFPLRAVSLRYFNVVGARSPRLADRSATNLVPMVFERIDAGQPPLIFGGDYGTADGTCVRDYIHVSDVADAHLVALEFAASHPGHAIFNVGTGVGTSVREMVDRILAVAGSELKPEVRDRRPGDADTVVASPELIAARTGWRARRSIEDMVGSAWTSHTGRTVPAV